MDQTTRKPADPSQTAKARKAAKAAKKIAKATAKRVGAARLKEFEQDAMAREDMLDGTPRPAILTPLVGRTVVPASNPGVGGSIVESDMDTDEMNPDKMTYQPGTTMEDDASSLSAIPTSPLKRMYTEVASPKAKKVAATCIQAALVPQPMMGLKAMQCEEGSATEPDSPPLTAHPLPSSNTVKATRTQTAQPQTRPAAAPKREANDAVSSNSETEDDSPPSTVRALSSSNATKSAKIQPQTTQPQTYPAAGSKSKVNNAVIADSTAEDGSPSSTTHPLPFNPKTPGPSKNPRKQRVPSPQDTDPESPPHKPQPRSLQRLESVQDLRDLDETFCKPAKKQQSVVKTVGSKGKGKDKMNKLVNDPAAAWRLWKSRQSAPGEQMDIDPPAKAGSAIQQKKKIPPPSIASSDSDIEVIEEDPKGKAKERVKAKTKGKGKGKGKEAEDIEMGTSSVTPVVLPAGQKPSRPVPKHSHQNDNETATK